MCRTNALELARDTELRLPLTQDEERRRKSGIPQEQIAQDRNKRPDGVAFKMPTKTKTGVICLLEFKLCLLEFNVRCHQALHSQR